jgi:predicted transcriptional regulator
MKPINLSQSKFEDLQPLLSGLRKTVLKAFVDHGPATTREISRLSGLDILTVRPRATELYQIGAIELLDYCGLEGVYRARTYSEWREAHEALAEIANKVRQQQLI